jgi:tRNA threonylcarbamoyladenosine dehydratase
MVKPKLHYQRRFGGITKLYGVQASARFERAHVGVIGIGGVGSWAVEAMARSGIGRLTLFDLDNVAESNVNRQIHALSGELGRPKVAVMQQRIEAINPHCRITAVEDFITRDNLADRLEHGLDYVVDCVDNFRTKAAIIAHCKRAKIRIITIGGAGGLTDPTRIAVADLANATQDALLGRTRRYLRYQYDFSRNPKRRFDVPCVYSAEQLRFPDGEGGTCRAKPGSTAGGLSCAGGLGSVMTVTASFGLVAAAHVLNKLAAQAAD